MTWQTYCNKYEILLNKNREFTSIRQELYFSINSSWLKSILKFFISIIKIFKYLLKSKKLIQKQEKDNIYFIDANTSANLGTLKPLYLEDSSKKLLVVNNKVKNASTFHDIQNSSLNFEDYYIVYFSDIKNIFMNTFTIAKVLNISFFTVFPLVVRYSFTKNSIENILSNIKAKNIFTSNDTLLASNMAILLAKKHKINDYTLQHGFLTHFYVPTTTTNYIVWGEKAKEWFENKNLSSQILPLGTPRLDEIETIKQNVRNIKDEFYKKYKIDITKKIFFYMSHSQAPEFGIELHRKNFEALKEVIKNEAYQLVIKLHPSESVNLFDEVFKCKKEKIILLPKNKNLYHTIVSSTICASAYSTTLVEAMCFEKPTLQMNMTQIKELPDYSIKEGCIAVKNIKEIKDILYKKDFSNEIRRQNDYVSKYFNNLGHATENILEHIRRNSAN